VKKRLKNDCFALPQGVHWTPVSEALDHLKSSLAPVADVDCISINHAAKRVLASPINATRAHPPFPNSAVDGYGFAHGGDGDLKLLDARAAAGAPFEGEVPTGTAIRILTGARPPIGVDTVVLQEDVTLTDGRVMFEAGLKKGSNIRPAGEDMSVGDILLQAGRVLTPGDIAMLASVGVDEVQVYAPLKVAVLSTGTEVVEVGFTAKDHQIYDANRPMLKSLLQAWNVEIIDLGCVADDRKSVLAALDRGAKEADVIVTSGGASAGDEDHISSSLKDAGALETWRIAIKPGRPLAMGLWSGTPVFGLPGNPVAAFVCSLLFVRPALRVMGGADWSAPEGMMLEAAFEKKKKPGREEYLRARRNGETVEVFASEGSGRVSGLSWSDGLVALDHDRGPVSKGDRVRYIPFSEFGIQT